MLFAWQECQVDGDTSSLWHIAKGIHKLEVCKCFLIKIMELPKDEMFYIGFQLKIAIWSCNCTHKIFVYLFLDNLELVFQITNFKLNFMPSKKHIFKLNCISYAYQLIHVMQFSFGLIPNVRAKGKASVRVADILNHMQAEEPVNTSDVILHQFKLILKQIDLGNLMLYLLRCFVVSINKLSFVIQKLINCFLLQMGMPEINTLILIDREVVLVSFLCTFG